MEDAKKSEPNDPNALALATADKKGIPSVRMVLLKNFSEKGFFFIQTSIVQRVLI
jgi:pyridoxamine 5'-phosphate oxidase